MTTIADVTGWLEQFAPSRLAEPWDNVGLLWGDPAEPVQRVMTCLTVTPTTATEAIHERAGLIVSHHPILFREVKKIRADLPETGYLWKLARAGIAVASPHTAFDNTHNGINDLLCDRLGLVDVVPLRPSVAAAPRSFKVVVFTPEPEREAVSSAAFNSGAGRIGAYEECSFCDTRRRHFLRNRVGQPHHRRARQARDGPRAETGIRLPVAKASRSAGGDPQHVTRMKNLRSTCIPCTNSMPRPARRPASAALAGWSSHEPLAEFALTVARALGISTLGMAGDPARRVERVAVACGAGDDFLKEAARAGADVLLTGEARFHRGIEAETLGVGLLVAGHYATERPGVELLATLLGRAFPNLAVWPSRTERDAFRLVEAHRE